MKRKIIFITFFILLLTISFVSADVFAKPRMDFKNNNLTEKLINISLDSKTFEQ